MRKPQAKIGPCAVPPTTEQIAAVSSVIGKLTSKGFDSRTIHNPILARYNKMLETLAFHRDLCVVHPEMHFGCLVACRLRASHASSCPF